MNEKHTLHYFVIQIKLSNELNGFVESGVIVVSLADPCEMSTVGRASHFAPRWRPFDAKPCEKSFTYQRDLMSTFFPFFPIFSRERLCSKSDIIESAVPRRTRRLLQINSDKRKTNTFRRFTCQLTISIS